MSASDVNLIWDVKAVECLCAFVHDFKVRIRTHYDRDKRFHFGFIVLRFEYLVGSRICLAGLLRLACS